MPPENSFTRLFAPVVELDELQQRVDALAPFRACGTP